MNEPSTVGKTHSRIAVSKKKIVFNLKQVVSKIFNDLSKQIQMVYKSTRNYYFIKLKIRHSKITGLL